MFRALRLHRTIASTPHLHWPAPCAEGGCYEAVDHDARFDSSTPSSIKRYVAVTSPIPGAPP